MNDPLNQLLINTKYTLLKRRLITLLPRKLWKIIAAIIILILADSLFNLPRQIRSLALLTLILALLELVFRLFANTISIMRAPPLRITRFLEITLNLKGNPLTSALQLSATAPSSKLTNHNQNNPRTANLIARSVNHGSQTASTILNNKSIPRAGAGRDWLPPSLITLTLTLALALSSLFIPRLFAFELPRLLNPAGHHPPFTWLNFNINLTPRQNAVYLGDDLTLRVTMTGKGAASLSRLELIPDSSINNKINPHTPSPQPIPLNRITDNDTNFPSANPHPLSTWGFTLHDLRAPVSFHLRAGRAISKPITITPITRPRILSHRLYRVLPPYTQIPKEPIHNESPPSSIPQSGTLQLQLAASQPIASIINIADPATTINTHISSEDPTRATITIPAAELGKHRAAIAIKNQSGEQSTDTVNLSYQVIKDQPPAITITSPARAAAATPTAVIPIEFISLDDLGFSASTLNLTVHRNQNDNPVLTTQQLPPIALPFDQTASPTIRTVDDARNLSIIQHARLNLDLSPLNLKPGDTLRYTAQIFDNRGISMGGPQLSISKTYEILIIDNQTLRAITDNNNNKIAESKSGNNDSQDDSEQSKSPPSASSKSTESPSDNNEVSINNPNANPDSANNNITSPNHSRAGGNPAPNNPPKALHTPASPDNNTQHQQNPQNQFPADLRNRAIFAGKPQSPATVEGITSKKTSENHEPLIYNFAQPRSAQPTTHANANNHDDENQLDQPITIPDSQSLRAIPKRYRNLVIDYFNKLSRTENHHDHNQ